jgi:hypothetical protein
MRLIGLRVSEGYQFPLRTVDSRRYMRLAEIEARMQDRDRVHRLRLNEIEAHEPVGLDARVDRDLDANEWSIVRVEEDVVILGRGALTVTVPLVYVETVYRAGLPRAAEPVNKNETVGS